MTMFMAGRHFSDLVSFHNTAPSPMANQFTLISPYYCAPYSINLQINTEKGVTYDIMTLHGRCQVFRGKSNDSSQLLFSVKRSSMIPCGVIKLDVFLANNRNESHCDFRVNVCKGQSSCTVYAGESPTIVARMENNGGFNIWVYPNVDYAFIVALLMIINDKNYYDELIDSFIDGATISLLDELTN
ncbi:LURP-one-related 15 [Spatholobus suberectus]|nr:LURP-one-related 15 [Spatholobus suberectus]